MDVVIGVYYGLRRGGHIFVSTVKMTKDRVIIFALSFWQRPLLYPVAVPPFLPCMQLSVLAS